MWLVTCSKDFLALLSSAHIPSTIFSNSLTNCAFFWPEGAKLFLATKGSFEHKCRYSRYDNFFSYFSEYLCGTFFIFILYSCLNLSYFSLS